MLGRKVILLARILIQVIELRFRTRRRRTAAAVRRGWHQKIGLVRSFAHGAQSRTAVVEDRVPRTWRVPPEDVRQVVAVDDAIDRGLRSCESRESRQQIELRADAGDDAASNRTGPPE